MFQDYFHGIDGNVSMIDIKPTKTICDSSLSIFLIYIIPFQGNYSEEFPISDKEESLKQFIKRSRHVSW